MMKQLSYSLRKLGFLALVACLLEPGTRLQADEQAESLGLLIQTLSESDDPAIQASLLRGMLSGLAGRRNVQAPSSWKSVSERLSASEDDSVRAMSQQLAQIFGDEKATARAMSTVIDKRADAQSRLAALRSLLMQRSEEVSDLLESLLDDPDLALDAIRGYAVIENPTAPAVLLQRYDRMSPVLKRAAIETLATRKRYAQALLGAVRRKAIEHEEIPAHIARTLDGMLGEEFTKVFGQVRQLAEDREKMLAKYRKMITPRAIAEADASRGRAVFEKTCASCHVLYGVGGKIGPDLTGSNRANLDYILLNSVDPSYDVPDGYKMVQVLTVDGRVISGVVAEEDQSRLVLKTVEQPTVVIAKEDIETRSVSKKSMMPDGQLDQMKPQQVADLIKYLRTTEQVEIVK